MFFILVLPVADKIIARSQDTRQYSPIQPRTKEGFRSRIMSLAVPTLLLIFVPDLASVLLPGFIASAMIFWPWCFSKTAIFQAVHKAALLLTMSIDVYLVSVALAKDDTEYNEEVMSPKSDAAMDPRFLLRSWRAWTENNNSLFVIVFLAACSVLIFSDVALANFESALWGDDLKRDPSFILFFCFSAFFPHISLFCRTRVSKSTVWTTRQLIRSPRSLTW